VTAMSENQAMQETKAVSGNEGKIKVARKAVDQAVAAGDHEELARQLSALRDLGVSRLTPKATNRRTTPLIDAVHGNQTRAISMLLDWCDADTADTEGHTALMYCVYQRSDDDLEAVKLLASASNLALTDKKGRTAAHWAICADRVDILELFTSFGGLPGSKKNTDTLLHFAVREQAKKCIRFLADRVDPNALNATGATALALAIELDRPEFAIQLAPLSGLGDSHGGLPGYENAPRLAACLGAAKCLTAFLPQIDWSQKDSLDFDIFDLCHFYAPERVKMACSDILELAVPLSIGRLVLARRHETVPLPILRARIEAVDLAETVAETEEKSDNGLAGAILTNSPVRKNRL